MTHSYRCDVCGNDMISPEVPDRCFFCQPVPAVPGHRVKALVDNVAEALATESVPVPEIVGMLLQVSAKLTPPPPPLRFEDVLL